jgi:cell division protein FtsW
MPVRYHQPDYFLITVLLVIIVFGMIMLSSASSVISYQKFGDSTYYLKHQLISFLIGIVAFFIAYKIDYRTWKKFAFPFLIITIGLLILVFMPGISFAYGGARRWIHLGNFLFQPTEVVKLTFLLYLATWLEKRGKGIHDFSYGFMPFIILLAVITFLVMSQPDLGTMTVIAVIAISTYFLAGAPLLHLSFIGLGGAALFALLIKIAPYRVQRFTVFLNPQLDPQGIGYHINQALLAIGSGGLFGLGLGLSRQKFNYLPEAAGDSIFAIMSEELGFIIMLGLIILFLLFMYRGFKIAKSAPDGFSRLLAAGITAWFSFQVFINIGSMTGILPLTGIPLPFISYGGSALIISMAAMGILSNISRQTK